MAAPPTNNMHLLRAKDRQKMQRLRESKGKRTLAAIVAARPTLQPWPPAARAIIEQLLPGSTDSTTSKGYYIGDEFRWFFEACRTFEDTDPLSDLDDGDVILVALMFHKVTDANPPPTRPQHQVAWASGADCGEESFWRKLGMTNAVVAHFKSNTWVFELAIRQLNHGQCKICSKQPWPSCVKPICVCGIDSDHYDWMLKIAFIDQQGDKAAYIRMPPGLLQLGPARADYFDKVIDDRKERVKTCQFCSERHNIICVCGLGQRTGRGIMQEATQQNAFAISLGSVPSDASSFVGIKRALKVKQKECRRIWAEAYTVLSEIEVAERREYYAKCDQCRNRWGGVSRRWKMCCCNPRYTFYKPLADLYAARNDEDFSELDKVKWEQLGETMSGQEWWDSSTRS